MKIGYMGMSHLGLVSSICSASFCKKIICFDLNIKKINQLKIIAKETVDIRGVGFYSLGSARKEISNDQKNTYLNLKQIDQ